MRLARVGGVVECPHCLNILYHLWDNDVGGLRYPLSSGWATFSRLRGLMYMPAVVSATPPTTRRVAVDPKLAVQSEVRSE